MDTLPLVATAIKGNWQRFIARKKNQRFLEIQKKIFLRDDNRCRYCGFYSERHQVVVNHDHDYSHNVASNMVTACMFCAQCLFLDQVGKNEQTGGYVIYLPEMSQTDLNHICRMLFVSLLKDTPYKGRLHSLYLSFKERTNYVEEIFGPKTSIPMILGQAIIDSNIAKEQFNKSLLTDLRVLPKKKIFNEEILYWKMTTYESIPL